jgi:transcriptional regulator with XRE-family HTH domain
MTVFLRMPSKKPIYRLIFGQTIKAELSRQHVTNLRLSKHCAVTPTAVTNWLKGTLPSLENVLAIVDFLDISLDRAFGRTPGTVDALRKVRRETAAVLGAIDCVLPDQSIVDGAGKEAGESRGGEGEPGEKGVQAASEQRAKQQKRKRRKTRKTKSKRRA